MRDEQVVSSHGEWPIRRFLAVGLLVLTATSCGVHLEQGAPALPGIPPYPTPEAAAPLASALQQARAWEQRAIALHSPDQPELASHIVTLTARLQEFGHNTNSASTPMPTPTAVTLPELQQAATAPVSDRPLLIAVHADRLLLAPHLNITVPPSTTTPLTGLSTSVSTAAAATRYTWEVARARHHDIESGTAPCEAALRQVENATPAEQRRRAPWAFPVVSAAQGAQAVREQLRARAFAVESALLAEVNRRTSAQDVLILTQALAAMEGCRRAWGGKPHPLPGIG